MKHFLMLILGALFFCASCADPPDPEKVLARARHYRLQGQYAKALKDHLWFHENALQYNPALYGVRLSFALEEWIALGADFPDAIRALAEIRDRKTELLEKGLGLPEIFHDVQSINRCLHEPQKTVALIKRLCESDFETAKQCYDLAKADLIASGEFALCNRLMDAPMFLARDMKALLKKNITIYKTAPWADTAQREWTVRHFMEEAEAVLVVLAKNQRHVEAERFIKDLEDAADMASIQNGLLELERKYLLHP